MKGKTNLTADRVATPIQSHAEDASANQVPSHEDIRIRAYEIYLERSGYAGNEFDDWRRAERELQKIAVFTRDWNRLQDQVTSNPNVEIAVPNAEERKTSSR